MYRELTHDQIELVIKSFGDYFDLIIKDFDLTPADAHYALERVLIDKFKVFILFHNEEYNGKWFKITKE